MKCYDFCPVCDAQTPHRVVDDEIFAFAIQCLQCGMIWEAEPPEKIEPVQLELPFED